LLEAEKEAMRILFPNFQLDKLDDESLCWVGQVNPRGADGGVWTLQAIYDHNHPHSDSRNGSVHVYSIKPDLDELHDELEDLPHVLRDAGGHFFMSLPQKDIDVRDGYESVFSAAKFIGLAVKWIWWFEAWLGGEVDEDDIELR
jgi:hypothetical protein